MIKAKSRWWLLQKRPHLSLKNFNVKVFWLGKAGSWICMAMMAWKNFQKIFSKNGGLMVMYLGKKWKEIAQQKELQVHPYLGIYEKNPETLNGNRPFWGGRFPDPIIHYTFLGWLPNRQVHPPKTNMESWNLKMKPWKRRFLWKTHHFQVPC